MGQASGNSLYISFEFYSSTSTLHKCTVIYLVWLDNISYLFCAKLQLLFDLKSSLFSGQNAHFKPAFTKTNPFTATSVLHKMIWNFWYELLWAFFLSNPRLILTDTIILPKKFIFCHIRYLSLIIWLMNFFPYFETMWLCIYVVSSTKKSCPKLAFFRCSTTFLGLS